MSVKRRRLSQVLADVKTEFVVVPYALRAVEPPLVVRLHRRVEAVLHHCDTFNARTLMGVNDAATRSVLAERRALRATLGGDTPIPDGKHREASIHPLNLRALKEVVDSMGCELCMYVPDAPAAFHDYMTFVQPTMRLRVVVCRNRIRKWVGLIMVKQVKLTLERRE